MPWYYVVVLVCMVIGPFSALRMHIRAQKRREQAEKEAREQAARRKGNRPNVRE